MLYLIPGEEDLTETWPIYATVLTVFMALLNWQAQSISEMEPHHGRQYYLGEISNTIFPNPGQINLHIVIQGDNFCVFITRIIMMTLVTTGVYAT
jgi:hypothetical protein